MKVLVAIDHSEASAKAVAFVGKMLGQQGSGSAEITLFHAVESLPDYFTVRSSSSANSAALQQVAADWLEHSQAEGQKLIEKVQQQLTAAGLPAAALHGKLVARDCLPEARRVMAALAIIEEMQGGRYDVVVLGRRGTSPAAESFIGSVTEKVLREARGKTVWVVD